ncbi:hypothetical protein GYB59_06120 [bacterium]|nr:hypothetical protein [bacterium]
MLMQRVSFTNDDTVLPADPRSSINLWQWISESYHRHRNLAAIVFSTSASHWPADLYVELNPSIGTEWVTAIDSQYATATHSDLQFVRDAHQQNFFADLKLEVHNPSGVGHVLQAMQSRGYKTWDRYDESLEIVFPYSIPSKLIHRIMPLYRTSKQRKRDRERRC